MNVRTQMIRRGRLMGLGVPPTSCPDGQYIDTVSGQCQPQPALPMFVFTRTGMQDTINNRPGGATVPEENALVFKSSALILALSALAGAGLGALVAKDKKSAAATGALLGGGAGSVYVGSQLLDNARNVDATPIAWAKPTAMYSGLGIIGFGAWRLYRKTAK